jgi:hypothetical protein
VHLRRRCLTTASDPIGRLLHGTILGRRGTAPDLRSFSWRYDDSFRSAHNPIAGQIITASRSSGVELRDLGSAALAE